MLLSAQADLRQGEMSLQRRNRARATVSYSWVILAVLFFGHIVTFGVRASFQAFISPWEQDFSVNRTVITSISMLSLAFFAFGQPFTGKLNDLFGKGIVPTIGIFLIGVSLFLTSKANQIWQIFALYGVGFSIGVACCTYSVVASIIAKWFYKKRGLALGLAMSGMAAGQLILAPTNMFIIERLGWRTAMGAMGIIVAVVGGPLFFFFLRSAPEEKGLQPYGYEESENEPLQNDLVMPEKNKPLPIYGLFRERAFWFLCIPYFLCGFTDVGIISTHLIPITQEKGFPSSGVALAISLAAAANIAGTIITGHLSDRFNRKRQLAIIYSIRSLTYVFLIFLRQPWLLLPFVLVFGLVEMATIAPTNSLVAQLFDKYSTGVVLGVTALCHQLGGAIGSWIPGLMYDLTGSYTAVLVLAILLLLCGAGMTLRLHVPGEQ